MIFSDRSSMEFR